VDYGRGGAEKKPPAQRKWRPDAPEEGGTERQIKI